MQISAASGHHPRSAAPANNAEESGPLRCIHAVLSETQTEPNPTNEFNLRVWVESGACRWTTRQIVVVSSGGPQQVPTGRSRARKQTATLNV